MKSSAKPAIRCKRKLRAFNLTITFNPEDIEFINGNAVISLSRASPDSVWQMTYWYDNSNY